MNDKKKLQTGLVIIGIILQMLGLIMHFYNNSTLALVFFIGALALIVSSFFALNAEEKKIEQIELNDERNTMIRNMAHAKTNTIMVFIQTIIAILCVFLKYQTLAILFASLVVSNGIIICMIGLQIEKKL